MNSMKIKNFLLEISVKVIGLLIGFIPLLLIIFKLTGILNWSWWWVLSPLWIPIAIILLVIIIGLIIAIWITK